MDCCGLSSTGLQDIDANNITSDNTTIYSSLNVSGFSNLNELTVNNNVTFITSLNVSGFTTLNETTLVSSLNVSGFTTLNNTTVISSLNVSGFTTLNNNTSLLASLNVSGFTNLNNNTTINGSLYISGLNVLETLNTHGTGLSTLYNFRSDNPVAIVSQDSTSFSTLIHAFYPGSEIQFDTILSRSNF